MRNFTNYTRLALACFVLSMAVARLHAGLTAQDVPASVPELLNSAFREYNANSNVKQAELFCERVIAALLPVTPLSDAQIQQLLTAYELRGRARVILKDQNGAREDFRALLLRSPSHEFGMLTVERGGPPNPLAISLFDTVRKETISTVIFEITPEDADVQFRNAPLPADRRAGGRPVQSPVGRQTVLVQRKMYEPQEVTVDVQPGIANRVEVSLKRLKSQIDIITTSPGVQVVIGNQSFGATTDAALPSKYAKLPEVVSLGTAPGFLTVQDIGPGSHTIRLTKDCFLPEDFTVRLDVPKDDYVVRPLKTAAGTLEITGPGGTVWVDGEDTRQTLPYKGELCPSPNGEPRVVEIRSARGRHVERVDPKPGVNVPIAATPRPAIAILAQNLLPQGYTCDERGERRRGLARPGSRRPRTSRSGKSHDGSVAAAGGHRNFQGARRAGRGGNQRARLSAACRSSHVSGEWKQCAGDDRDQARRASLRAGGRAVFQRKVPPLEGGIGVDRR